MSDPTPAFATFDPTPAIAVSDPTPAIAVSDPTPAIAVSDPDVKPEESKEPEEPFVQKPCKHGVRCWDGDTCTQCAANPEPYVREEPFELAPGQEKPRLRLANIACLQPKRPLFTGRHTKP
jgi:hypothetical protein